MTTNSTPFPPVAGALLPEDQIDLLRALGDTDTADKLQDALDEGETPGAFSSRGRGLFGLFPLRAWQHTEHAFGYFPPLPANGSIPSTLDIQDAGMLRPDASLKGKRIKVVLSHLHIHDYPGPGLLLA